MYKIYGKIVDEVKDYNLLINFCNCFHDMETGSAREIRLAFPAVLESDKTTYPGDKSKLGTISSVDYDEFSIINAYVIYDMKPSKSDPVINHNSLRSVLRLVKKHYPNRKILIPMFNAKMSSKKWNDVKSIIKDELKSDDFSIIYSTEKLFYLELARDATEMHKQHLNSYKNGANGLIGLFTAQAMKDSKSTADPTKLLKIVYNHIKAII